MKETDLLFGIMVSLAWKEYSVKGLLQLTKPFGLSESSLRTALSRMLKKGLVKKRKVGKSAFYSFANEGMKIGENIAETFSNPDWHDWKGEWWELVFSVPADESPERYPIRKTLKENRFGMLYPGVWIRPHQPDKNIIHRFQRPIASGYCKMSVSRFIPELTAQDAASIWDLKHINKQFFETLNTIKDSISYIKNATSEQAFIEKFKVGDGFVKTLNLDPLLPEALLPHDWTGYSLKTCFNDWNTIIAEKSKPFIEKMAREESL